MSFESKCPLCGTGFQAEEDWIGQTAECPSCGKDIKIQASEKPVLQAASMQKEQEAQSSENKSCPFCGEVINIAAIKCKHCRSDLTSGKDNKDGIRTVNQETPGQGDANKPGITDLKMKMSAIGWIQCLSFAVGRIWKDKAQRKKLILVGAVLLIGICYYLFILISGMMTDRGIKAKEDKRKAEQDAYFEKRARMYPQLYGPK